MLSTYGIIGTTRYELSLIHICIPDNSLVLVKMLYIIDVYMKNNRLFNTAIIASIYVVLCLLLSPISFGPIQFRVSELLCLLTIEFPYLTIGVTAGCFISNLLFGGLGIVDAVFGSLATLIGCYIGYLLRNIRYKNYPVLSTLMISIVNGIIVGTEIGIIYENVAMIPITILEITISEIIILVIIGLPIYNKLKDVINIRLI